MSDEQALEDEPTLEDEQAPTLEDGNHEFVFDGVRMIRENIAALVAAAFPVAPPSKWFEDPGLDRLTPLTIEDDGRVYGHIAGWRSSHIGLSAGVKPPKSKSGYMFFQTGSLRTAEGENVNVGQITLTGGHAPLEASVSEAVRHYDDTDSAIMDVACGEDRHGIWVAGSLRPDVDESKLRAMRASSVSGDWRPINGRLELVAVCAVNCPGFPIPRARVASGAQVALVAAGTGPIIEEILMASARAEQFDGEAEAAIDRRLRRIEQIVLDSQQLDVLASSGENQLSEAERRREASRARRIRHLEQTVATLVAAAREQSAENDAEKLQALAASARNQVNEARKDILRRRAHPTIA